MILLYIVSFAVGLGPTYWLLADEVFPTRLRGIGSSISTVGSWTASLLVSSTFLTLINALGKPVTFWIYAAFVLVEVLFAYALVPETKHRPLEAIEDSWENGRSWQNVDHGSVGRRATGRRPRRSWRTGRLVQRPRCGTPSNTARKRGVFRGSRRRPRPGL